MLQAVPNADRLTLTRAGDHTIYGNDNDRKDAGRDNDANDDGNGADDAIQKSVETDGCE